MDLTKLTPAECWHPENWDNLTLMHLKSKVGATDLQFIRLARLAFEVMMRRGWGVTNVGRRWFLSEENCPEEIGRYVDGQDDPFTALVEADKWYRENVEAKKGATG